MPPIVKWRSDQLPFLRRNVRAGKASIASSTYTLPTLVTDLQSLVSSAPTTDTSISEAEARFWTSETSIPEHSDAVSVEEPKNGTSPTEDVGSNELAVAKPVSAFRAALLRQREALRKDPSLFWRNHKMINGEMVPIGPGVGRLPFR